MSGAILSASSRRLLLRALPLELVLNLRAHFVDRLRVDAACFSTSSDDVESVVRLDDVAHLARFQRERRLLELGDHATAAEQTEVAALVFVRVVFGVGLAKRRSRRPT